MQRPKTVRSAETLGRIRLSATFFMREFLHSEIASVHGFDNLPDDPDLAIKAGRQLCEELLVPLQAAFGRISIRSGYRSPEVNAFGNGHYRSCASNEHDRARHIWDHRDADGNLGAMATIVVPCLADRIAAGGDWQSLAWWIHDHLPYSELQFFPKLAAFSIGWRERPLRRITSFAALRGLLTKVGMANHGGNHSEFYLSFPNPVLPLDEAA